MYYENIIRTKELKNVVELKEQKKFFFSPTQTWTIFSDFSTWFLFYLGNCFILFHATFTTFYSTATNKKNHTTTIYFLFLYVQFAIFRLFLTDLSFYFFAIFVDYYDIVWPSPSVYEVILRCFLHKDNDYYELLFIGRLDIQLLKYSK